MATTDFQPPLVEYEDDLRRFRSRASAAIKAAKNTCAKSLKVIADCRELLAEVETSLQKHGKMLNCKR
jgi:hypothetical protein